MVILWWTALKKSLSCKSQGSCDDVTKQDDGTRGGNSSASATCLGLKKSPFLLQPPPPPPSSSSLPTSRCSRSISNLRDVIHSARFQAPPGVRGSKLDSPMSVESGGVLNAVTHDMLLATGAQVSASRHDTVGAGAAQGLAAGDIGAVPPFAHSPLQMRCATGGARLSQMKSPLRLGAGDLVGSPFPAWASGGDDVGVRCNRCGGRFPNDNILESHHLVYHAVSEVVGGETTASKVVELIYSVGWPNPEAALDRVERVVKVHNMERRVDRFKEHMEEVKCRAARLPNKHHPRCVADGNELLRFHGTTVSCSLGAGGSRSVCTSSLCNVCRIIRHGFSATRESRNGGGGGVFTTSTSRHALECVQESGGEDGPDGGSGGEDGLGGGVRRALLVCRVIAGRIHRPLPLEKRMQDVAVQPGFDSVAGKVGDDDSSIEELYLLNPSAILPCFVVICKA